MSGLFPMVAAGDQTLDQFSPGPDMTDAIGDLASPITLFILNSSAGPGGDAVISKRIVQTNGALLATTARKLEIKMEGTRKWKAFMLYAIDDPHVSIQDQIIINDVPYRVMNQWDRTQFGFVKIGLLQDFQNAS